MAILDPENPGRYVLGIECDGASYHSSPVARARDRQREGVLEDRGWRIHRIWSTDWYREQERTKERLLTVVNDALETRGSAISGSGDRNPDEDESVPHEVEGHPSIEELHGDGAGITVTDIGEEYGRARDVPFSKLSEHDVRSTSGAVIHIVEREGPIHRDLLAKRVVESSDVERRGKKVSRTIDKAISQAETKGNLMVEGDFLHPPSLQDIPIRRRTGMEAEIEWIPSKEIEGGIVEILEKQYETPKDDLIKQVGTVFGFNRTGTRISKRIGDIIDGMVEAGRLEERNGRLSISDGA